MKNVIFDGNNFVHCSSNSFSNTNIKKIIVPVDYINGTIWGINVEKLKDPKFSEPGYYKNKANSNTYIKCTNSGCETIQKPTEQKHCTSDNDGKLIYDG